MAIAFTFICMIILVILGMLFSGDELGGVITIVALPSIVLIALVPVAIIYTIFDSLLDYLLKKQKKTIVKMKNKKTGPELETCLL